MHAEIFSFMSRKCVRGAAELCLPHNSQLTENGLARVVAYEGSKRVLYTPFTCGDAVFTQCYKCKNCYVYSSTMTLIMLCACSY